MCSVGIRVSVFGVCGKEVCDLFGMCGCVCAGVYGGGVHGWGSPAWTFLLLDIYTAHGAASG